MTKHISTPTPIDPQLLENKICGASAGAITAVALITGIPLEEMARHVIKLANNYKVLSVNVSLKEVLDKLLPDDIAVNFYVSNYVR